MFSKIKRFIRSYALLGRNVTCCLCQKQFITFLPSGDEIKAHSRCPGCYSTDRQRQLWLTIRPLLLNTNKQIRILHIAPEKTISAQLLKMSNVQYDAIDKFEQGYSYPAYVKEMDLESLQFEKDTFDLFLCSHVLEHITDDDKALQELYRILKPGGTGFIMVPYYPELESTYEDFTINNPEQRKAHFGQADHVRKYGSDFPKKLKNAGFEPETLSIDKTYTNAQKVRLGLINAELIFKVRKR